MGLVKPLGKLVTPVAFYNGIPYALVLNAAGELVVSVVTSALPSGAATAVNQATMITALELIDDLRGALADVGDDELRTNIIASALPSGAATDAKLDTIVTAVELIDDLRAALCDVGTDELRTDLKAVLGEPVGQPDWHIARCGESVSDLNSGADTDSIASTPVPSGDIEVVQAVAVLITSSTCSRILVLLDDSDNGLYVPIMEQRDPTSGVYYIVNGAWDLQEGDQILVYFYDLTANDDMYLRYWGRKIKD